MAVGCLTSGSVVPDAALSVLYFDTANNMPSPDACMHACNYVHMSMGEVFAWCHSLTDCRVRVNAKLNTAADHCCVPCS